MKTIRRRSIPLNLLAHLRGLRGKKQGFETLKPLSTVHSSLLKGQKCLEMKPGRSTDFDVFQIANQAQRTLLRREPLLSARATLSSTRDRPMEAPASSRRRSTASSVATSGQESRPRRVRPSRARGLRTSTGWWVLLFVSFCAKWGPPLLIHAYWLRFDL